MKITKSAIHKLQVESSCGCSVAGEYSDVAYKDKVGDNLFSPCSAHKGKPGVEMLGDILGQVLTKEAKEAAAPVIRVSRPMVEGREVPAPGAPRPLSAPKSAPVVMTGRGDATSALPTGVSPRMGAPTPAANAVARSVQTSRGGGGASASTGKKAASASKPRPRVETVTQPEEVFDIEPQDEDPRITQIMQHSGVEELLESTDLGDEGEDMTEDDIDEFGLLDD
jgi:hypothetical protein